MWLNERAKNRVIEFKYILTNTLLKYRNLKSENISYSTALGKQTC